MAKFFNGEEYLEINDNNMFEFIDAKISSYDILHSDPKLVEYICQRLVNECSFYERETLINKFSDKAIVGACLKFFEKIDSNYSNTMLDIVADNRLFIKRATTSDEQASYTTLDDNNKPVITLHTDNTIAGIIVLAHEIVHCVGFANIKDFSNRSEASKDLCELGPTFIESLVKEYLIDNLNNDDEIEMFNRNRHNTLMINAYKYLYELKLLDIFEEFGEITEENCIPYLLQSGLAHSDKQIKDDLKNILTVSGNINISGRMIIGNIIANELVNNYDTAKLNNVKDLINNVENLSIKDATNLLDINLSKEYIDNCIDSYASSINIVKKRK